MKLKNFFLALALLSSSLNLLHAQSIRDFIKEEGITLTWPDAEYKKLICGDDAGSYIDYYDVLKKDSVTELTIQPNSMFQLSPWAVSNIKVKQHLITFDSKVLVSISLGGEKQNEHEYKWSLDLKKSELELFSISSEKSYVLNCEKIED